MIDSNQSDGVWLHFWKLHLRPGKEFSQFSSRFSPLPTLGKNFTFLNHFKFKLLLCGKPGNRYRQILKYAEAVSDIEEKLPSEIIEACCLIWVKFSSHIGRLRDVFSLPFLLSLHPEQVTCQEASWKCPLERCLPSEYPTSQWLCCYRQLAVLLMPYLPWVLLVVTFDTWMKTGLL